jgi:hypothetical protein
MSRTDSKPIGVFRRRAVFFNDTTLFPDGSRTEYGGWDVCCRLCPRSRWSLNGALPLWTQEAAIKMGLNHLIGMHADEVQK